MTCWDLSDPGDHPIPTHVIFKTHEAGTTQVRYQGQPKTDFYLNNLGDRNLIAFCITQPKESQP